MSLFAKYIKLKNKFNYALDIGANLGLHTIILSRLGYNVKSFEADPTTFKKLKINLERNLCQNYKIYNFALSDFNGSSKFYQVTDNLTPNTFENSLLSPNKDIIWYYITLSLLVELLLIYVSFFKIVHHYLMILTKGLKR